MEWNDRPASLPISPAEVHVWQAAVGAQRGQEQRLFAFLDENERRRAQRFSFPEDRQRFILAHGLLRSLLGRYLGCPPGEIGFGFGPRGKPFLSAPANGAGLAFNMSHSGDWAVFAFALGRQVGIDVEHMRPRENVAAIAARFFSPQECAALAALPPAGVLLAFYTGWTCKEAYLKATGAGLSLPLDSFSVSLAPGEPAALLASELGADELRRWRLLSFSPAPGYAAALAVEGQAWEFKSFILSDPMEIL